MLTVPQVEPELGRVANEVGAAHVADARSHDGIVAYPIAPLRPSASCRDVSREAHLQIVVSDRIVNGGLYLHILAVFPESYGRVDCKMHPVF